MRFAGEQSSGRGAPRGWLARLRRRAVSHAIVGVVGIVTGLYLASEAQWLARGAAAVLPAPDAPAADFAWRVQPAPAFPIPPYARHLDGVRIVVDPGHGGRAARKGWKRGPTGLREAEVNLRVALRLREFLEAVGAEVTLTRMEDVWLAEDMGADLRARAELANDLRADLFLSIHHNGAATPAPNYTSIFYHADPDHSPASLDAARQLAWGISDALRLAQHLPNPLVSDYAIFPERGFAVLRECEVPAVLTESSFHSNPSEEARLRDAVYNRREAYGLFLGLARWAQAGLPRIALERPEDGRVRRGEAVVVRLDDGLARRGGFGSELRQWRLDSLVVELDGSAIAHRLNAARGELTIPWSRRMRGAFALRVDFENAFGQHVVHPVLRLRGE